MVAVLAVERLMDDVVCRHCGDRIGVYEPLVALADGHVRETSRAADPLAGADDVLCFHRECFERLHGERALPR